MRIQTSPIALQHPRRADAITRRDPWGYLLHTTGSGICAKAQRTGKLPIRVALDWYRQSQDGANGYPWGGPTFVIEHNGTIHQIADEDILTNHAGGPHRHLYLSGAWVDMLPAEVVARWRAQWPGFASPQHLYPSRTANADYVGCEMIPCGAGFGTPMRAGLRFTREQHEAAIALGRDLARRYGWSTGWARTPRLLGHEDVQPIERHDTLGGWDPGWLRPSPYFDFGLVRAALG